MEKLEKSESDQERVSDLKAWRSNRGSQYYILEVVSQPPSFTGSLDLNLSKFFL